MCPDRFLLTFKWNSEVPISFGSKVFAEKLFSTFGQLFLERVEVGSAYIMKIFPFIGKEYTLKKLGLQVEFSMLQLEFYVQNLDMNFQKQF